MNLHAKITTTLLMALSATALYGQKAIPDLHQAFDTFSQQLEKSHFTTHETKIEEEKAICLLKTFAIPKKKSGCFETYRNALVANGRIAYTSYSQKAGARADDDSQKTITINFSYGKDGSQYIVFGNDSRYNYEMRCLRAPKDSTMRYVYAVKWNTDNDSVVGTAYKLYGLDPKRRRRSRTYTFGNRYSLDSLHQLDSLSSRLSVLRKLDSLDLGRNARVYMIDSNREITNSEFLQKLSNLRAALKTAKGEGDSKEKTLTLQTGVVNKIVELCNRHGHVLSLQEVYFCKSALKAMKKEISDDYLCGLLDLTANNLGTKKQSK